MVSAERKILLEKYCRIVEKQLNAGICGNAEDGQIHFVGTFCADFAVYFINLVTFKNRGNCLITGC